MSKVNKSIFPGQQTAGPILDNQGGELVYIETSETQQEELIITLNIGILPQTISFSILFSLGHPSPISHTMDLFI